MSPQGMRIFGIALLWVGCAHAADPLKPIASYNQYVFPQENIAVSDNDLVFSEWDRPGYTQNIMALDTTTGRVSLLARGEGDVRFLDRDSRYVVFADNAPVRHDADNNPIFTNYTVLLDRTTGKVLEHETTDLPLQWARIDGNYLVGMGRRSLVPNSFDSYQASMRILSLSSLRLFAEGSIHANAMPILWKDLILTLDKHQLVALGQDLKPQFAIAIPPWAKPQHSSQLCFLDDMKVYGDQAVVADECGGLAVIDLQSRQLKWLFQTKSFAIFAAVGDVLFSTTCDNYIPAGVLHHIYLTPDHLQAYNLESGRSYADVPIPRLSEFEKPSNRCVDLYNVGNRLLEVGFSSTESSSLTLYDVKTSAMQPN
jgi:hypothetical protein